MRFKSYKFPWNITQLKNLASYSKKRTSVDKKHFVSTENMLKNYQGIEQYKDESNVSGIQFYRDDILLANIRPYLRKVWRAAFDGAASTDVLVIHSVAQSALFLKYIIANDKFIDYVMSAAKGSKMPRGDKDFIMNYSVGYPSLPEQEKIAEFLSLVDERIEQQRQLVEVLKRYKRGVINKVFSSLKQTDMMQLKDLVAKGHVKLGRGNVIPKYKKDKTKVYPVYSSSTHNEGLMGFYDSFMFDKELITWSIDGGGNFFYRKAHKFNVTNVCGILELDTTLYNYKFIAECLIHQHERKHFDYLSKAHPSVIIDMYELPGIPIDVQQKHATLFLAFDELIVISEQVGEKLKQVKTALLQQMFI